MKITADEFDNLRWDSKNIVLDEAQSPHRWYTPHRIVFRMADKLWETIYDVGNTEMQKIDQPAEFEITEVEPYEKTVTAYRPVK